MKTKYFLVFCIILLLFYINISTALTLEEIYSSLRILKTIDFLTEKQRVFLLKYLQNKLNITITREKLLEIKQTIYDCARNPHQLKCIKLYNFINKLINNVKWQNETLINVNNTIANSTLKQTNITLLNKSYVVVGVG